MLGLTLARESRAARGAGDIASIHGGNRTDGRPSPVRSILQRMCRSIKTLRTGAVPAGDDEITAAALQYVRKVSGYRKPSAANEHAFEEAVETVAAASRQLLDAVAATHPHARRIG